MQTGLTLCAQSCFARYTVYPNPATEYVTVEFDEAESAEALPDKIELLSEESTKPVKELNVQEAFSNRTLKNGNRVEISGRDKRQRFATWYVLPAYQEQSAERFGS